MKNITIDANKLSVEIYNLILEKYPDSIIKDNPIFQPKDIDNTSFFQKNLKKGLESNKEEILSKIKNVGYLPILDIGRMAVGYSERQGFAGKEVKIIRDFLSENNIVMIKQKKEKIHRNNKNQRPHNFRPLFIHNASMKYLKNDNRMTYDEALKRAQTDYENYILSKKEVNNEVQKVVDEDLFPSLNEKYKKIAMEILRNCVLYGSKLSFVSHSYGLGIDRYHQWESFCVDVMKNVDKISRHLCVQNKFVIKKEGDINTISYNKL